MKKKKEFVVVVVVQSLSCPTLCDPVDCSKPDSSVLHYLLEFAQTYVHCGGDAISSSATVFLFLFCFFSRPSVFSSIRVFPNELALCMRWPKYWAFSFSISPSNELLFSHSPWTVACQAPLSSTISSNTCPLSWWCYIAISSSVTPLSFLLPSFPALGSFLMSQLFASGGQSIGASASRSVLPMNIQGWFPLVLTGWFSLQSKGLSRVFSNTTVQKHQFFGDKPFLWSRSHIRSYLLEKTIALTIQTFVGKVMSLFFNMLSRFVIGEGNGTPLQYSCLENPMDGRAW